MNPRWIATSFYGFLLLVGWDQVWSWDNPWDLPIEERVVNRKNVSHLVVDQRREEYRLVLLTGERFPYNYKSANFPLFFRLETETSARELLVKINRYLETGKEMTLFISGSEIRGVVFHDPYERIP